MKLSEEIIKLIREKKELKRELIYRLNIHQKTLEKWLRENEENNKLTTFTALSIIKEHTKKDFNDILLDGKNN